MKTYYISSNEWEVIFYTDCDGYQVMHYIVDRCIIFDTNICDEVKHHK